MYQMNHDILFQNEDGQYKLQLLSEVNISTSSESLTDTAEIILPESILNTVLNLEDKLYRGTVVSIKLGYDTHLKTEFVGYVKELVNRNGTLTIECEDALFLFRKPVADREFKPAAVKTILQYLIDQIDSSYELVMDVDYGVTYEKFTIYQADAFDVLKKLQEELKANIYFDTEKKELHFNAPYKAKGGRVVYNMNRNVESSSLEYKMARNRKVEVVIESTGQDGQVREIKVGTTGGDQKKLKVGPMSHDDMKKIAEVMLQSEQADRYEGSIDTWLVPFVRPTYTADFSDADYPQRNGRYYVSSVETSFSDRGGKRTIKFGIKL